MSLLTSLWWCGSHVSPPSSSLPHNSGAAAQAPGASWKGADGAAAGSVSVFAVHLLLFVAQVQW